MTHKSLGLYIIGLLLTSTFTLQAQEKPAEKPAAKAEAPKVDKEAGTFKDGKRGDVPEGAAEMVTPAVER